MKSLRVFHVRNLSSLIAEEKTNKRKNHPIPLPTASTSFSGVLLSPPLGASERKLHPAGALHSTTALAPSYDLNSGWVSSVAHNRSTTNSCGVGSNVVDEGYEGPCSVIFTPRGAAVKGQLPGFRTIVMMNAHDNLVYSARNSGSCAMGMTAITLSDSPCLTFVLLRHAHVPLPHCIDHQKVCF